MIKENVLSKQDKQKQRALRNRALSDDPYEDFSEVHYLVADSYAKYEEQGNLKRCLKELGNSILSLSKQQ